MLPQVVRRSLLLALPFQVGALVVALVLYAAGLPAQVLLTVLLVVSMWAPAAAELVFRTTLPRALQLHYLIFITLGPYAGSALNVYVAIADWDTLIHFDSGVMLAWLGMLWVRRMEERVNAEFPTWFGLAVIQLTAMAFAAAWEICEFASDNLIGTVAQGGLDDTMSDIMAGTMGGLFAIALLLILGRPRSLAPASLLRPEYRTAAAEGQRPTDG
ncbi:hypothetical protein GCM10025760_03660 [Microbacterium yannicii]|uniref:DUF2238 domain-containing protein n=1 Tax=Microbacterium yannicii TaxID=671622 RepID=A0ABP9LWY2_9MICO|nr:hypothetical protein [Microbacterium yannicii]MCO5953719.1 hypothetical protein [Microbacterium yannicii]